GGIIPMHTHKYEETLYILSGRGVVCAGETKRSVGADEYVYIGGSVPHALINDGNTLFEFLCIIPYIEDMRIERSPATC
ncbi:MAG: cupin domain-containing protein, partial [Thermoprotei archaeon]